MGQCTTSEISIQRDESESEVLPTRAAEPARCALLSSARIKQTVSKQIEIAKGDRPEGPTARNQLWEIERANI